MNDAQRHITNARVGFDSGNAKQAIASLLDAVEVILQQLPGQQPGQQRLTAQPAGYKPPVQLPAEVTHDTPCPFSKHLGVRMGDVPAEYLLWIYQQPWLPKKYPGVHAYIAKHADNLRRDVPCYSDSDDDDIYS